MAFAFCTFSVRLVIAELGSNKTVEESRPEINRKRHRKLDDTAHASHIRNVVAELQNLLTHREDTSQTFVRAGKIDRSGVVECQA